MDSSSLSSEWPLRSSRVTNNRKPPPSIFSPAITLPHSQPNINQISNRPASEQYRLWFQTYGPVFQIQLGNTPVVIVNPTQAAKSIFLSQGSAINSRPVLAFFHQKASSAALSIGMSPWDESCKKKRKVAATSLNRSRTVGYHPVRVLSEGNLRMELT
jgi:3-hydroxyphenylacetate 6-hydroxylase